LLPADGRARWIIYNAGGIRHNEPLRDKTHMGVLVPVRIFLSFVFMGLAIFWMKVCSG
jgi:hypothetical protein